MPYFFQSLEGLPIERCKFVSVFSRAFQTVQLPVFSRVLTHILVPSCVRKSLKLICTKLSHKLNVIKYKVGIAFV